MPHVVDRGDEARVPGCHGAPRGAGRVEDEAPSVSAFCGLHEARLVLLEAFTLATKLLHGDTQTVITQRSVRQAFLLRTRSTLWMLWVLLACGEERVDGTTIRLHEPPSWWWKTLQGRTPPTNLLCTRPSTPGGIRPTICPYNVFSRPE